MISYYKSVSQPAEDFDAVKFGQITRHPSLKRICDRILQAGDNHDEVSRLKRQLPAVTWQAWQPEGEMRSAQKCEPNGLFMIDVDHVDDPRGLYERIKTELENWKRDVIMLAHVTPSGKGLRIVAKRYNATMSIPDCQEVFCSHYGIECDKAVKDVSRLSFLVPWDYILYFDEGIFETDDQTAYPQPLPKGGEADSPLGESGIAAGGIAAGGVAAKESSAGETDPRSGSAPLPSGGVGDGLLLFHNIPIKDIVSEVVERTGGAPVVGERNSRLYEIARILRYIVDFDANKLTAILPSFGLPTSEVAQVAQSAVKSNRAQRMPDTLYNIIQEAKQIENDFSEDDNNDDQYSHLDTQILPRVFKDFADTAPTDFKIPVVISLLPILGTLASTARAKYLDGTYHSPSFISVIVAPQASGKSFARRLVRVCLASLEAEDMKARLDEQLYRKALREAKNSKSQPKEPETMVRCVPASISVAKLLKRLDNARGLHLFTFCEEVDTIAKSNNSGAWAQKGDIYRNAFDNAVYGQDYMTDISYSASLEVFYNLLLLGTPNAVGRFFKDPEDGLVSRVCFAEIPDQFGADMPLWGEMDRDKSVFVRNVCQKLLDKHSNPQEKQYYDLSVVNEALRKWLKAQRDMAILAVDRARDTARRRAAVVGFRAALVAKAINEVSGTEASDEQISTFATYIADVYLNTMLSMYGTALDNALSKTTNKTSTFFNVLFDNLSDVFSVSDLYAYARKRNLKTPIKKILSMWRKSGLIEDVEKLKTYKKITK